MECLINELSSLIDLYINRPFILKEDIVREIIELIVSSRSLEEFYSQTLFNYNNTGKDIASYNGFNDIDVYYNILVKNLNIPEGQLFNNLELNIYPLIKLLFYFYHESEHINQRRLWYYPEPTVESAIIKASRFEIMPLIEKICRLPLDEQEKERLKIETKAHEYRQIYRQNYIYAPTERMANIKAYDFILKLLAKSTYFDDLNELYNYMTTQYFYCTAEAYFDVSSPTKYYLMQQKVHLSWWRLALKIHQLTMDEKIYLGLTLSDQDILNLLNRKKDFSLKLTNPKLSN